MSMPFSAAEATNRFATSASTGREPTRKRPRSAIPSGVSSARAARGCAPRGSRRRGGPPSRTRRRRRPRATRSRRVSRSSASASRSAVGTRPASGSWPSSRMVVSTSLGISRGTLPSRFGAVDAPVELARSLGLEVSRPVLLGEGMCSLWRLDPAPVVARVTRFAHLVWPVEVVAGGVALARHLGELAVQPSSLVDPGPHVLDGRYVTFWSVAEGPPASPEEAGTSLRALHERARSFAASLRSFDPRPEAVRLTSEPALREAAERLELPELPAQPIHGDAHLGNVLAGGRWLDFDEACSGPPEWDLACVRHRLLVFGELQSEIEAALAAYGDHDEDAVAACDPLVVLFTATWGSSRNRDHPASAAPGSTGCASVVRQVRDGDRRSGRGSREGVGRRRRRLASRVAAARPALRGGLADRRRSRVPRGDGGLRRRGRVRGRHAGGSEADRPARRRAAAPRSPCCGSPAAPGVASASATTWSGARSCWNGSAGRSTSLSCPSRNATRSSSPPPSGSGARRPRRASDRRRQGAVARPSSSRGCGTSSNGPCSRRAVDHAPACAARRGEAHRDETAVLVHGDIHQWNALEAAEGFKLSTRTASSPSRSTTWGSSCARTR